MSASAIKRMQSLAWKSRVIANGMELGPWFDPRDKDAARSADPRKMVKLTNGEEMTVQDVFEAISFNTQQIIRHFPDVYDITDHVPALYESIQANGLGGLRAGDEGFIELESIPLVGPVEVTPGWFQIQDDRALCIMPRQNPDDPTAPVGSFLVWVVIVPHDSAGPLNGRCLSPFAATMTVTADGKFRPHGHVDALHTLLDVLGDFYAVLVALSIMQADPKVVRTARRPSKSSAKKQRNHTAYDSLITIALPGLRYDKHTGHWTAKTSGGVAWHMVRGHYRLLQSERYKNKQGQRVWVKAHSKGNAAKPAARKRYVIGPTT